MSKSEQNRPKLVDRVVLVGLLVSIAAAGLAIVSLLDDSTELATVNAARDSRLALHLDDLATTVLHLDPALLDSEDSFDDILEDIEDEMQLSEDALQLRGIDGLEGTDVLEALERSREIHESEARPRPSVDDLLEISTQLRASAKATLAHMGVGDDTLVEAHAAVSDEITRIAEEVLGRETRAPAEMSSVLSDVAASLPDVPEPEIFVWTDGPASFEQFDQLSEVLATIDTSLAEAPVGSHNDSLATALLLAAGAGIGVCGVTLRLRHRQRRQQEAHMVEQLRQLADRDPLTGLLNRSGLEQAFAEVVSAGETVSVLFVDLDHFKSLNDENGHDVGDLALRQVAERLRRLARPDDRVARVGGDEFLVLIAGKLGSDGAMSVAERVTHALSQPYLVEGRTLRLGASVGLATADAAEADLRSLMTEADAALYEVKRSGRGRAAAL